MLSFYGSLMSCKCGFKIGETKMNEIINKGNNKKSSGEMIEMLCDRCGKEFYGQDWMATAKKEVVCPKCYEDVDL